MSLAKALYGISLLCLFYGADVAANPLSPQTPVVAINTGNIQSAPMVCGDTTGFIVAGTTSGSGLLETSFSSDGMTWSSPSMTSAGTNYAPWIAGTSPAFVATLITPAIGFLTATPVSLFSSDNGTTWGAEVIIESSSTIATPVIVSQTTAGFLATWDDANDNNAYSSFSSDNGSTWSSVTQITTSSALFSSNPHFSAVAVSSTTAGSLATWLQSDQNAYASFSNNNGSSWSSVVAITNTGDVNSDIFVSGNADGFMTTWVNSSNIAYSSFSSDNGSTWSAPVQIATGLVSNNLSGSGANVFISGSTAGFVVAWIGVDNNAYASFSSDSGSSWSSPVAITNDGTVSYNDPTGALGYVSVAAVGDTCLFVWIEYSGNVLSSFSTIGGSSAPPRSYTRPCTRRGGA